MQLATQPNTQNDPVALYIECDGIVSVVLDKLNKPHDTSCPNGYQCKEHNRYTEGSLTLELATHLDRLQDAIRARAMMASFSAAMTALFIAQGKAQAMEPFEASKTATNLLRQVAELTDRKAHTEVNINQLIYDRLPDQEARDAWLFLTNTDTSNQPANFNQPANIIDMEE